jgi:hypothetical protein
MTFIELRYYVRVALLLAAAVAVAISVFGCATSVRVLSTAADGSKCDVTTKGLFLAHGLSPSARCEVPE